MIDLCFFSGYLDQNGFFVALKLVALAQKGLEINLANISADTSPPDMVIYQGDKSCLITY